MRIDRHERVEYHIELPETGTLLKREAIITAYGRPEDITAAEAHAMQVGIDLLLRGRRGDAGMGTTQAMWKDLRIMSADGDLAAVEIAKAIIALSAGDAVIVSVRRKPTEGVA